MVPSNLILWSFSSFVIWGKKKRKTYFRFVHYILFKNVISNKFNSPSKYKNQKKTQNYNKCSFTEQWKLKSSYSSFVIHCALFQNIHIIENVILINVCMTKITGDAIFLKLVRQHVFFHSLLKQKACEYFRYIKW